MWADSHCDDVSPLHWTVGDDHSGGELGTLVIVRSTFVAVGRAPFHAHLGGMEMERVCRHPRHGLELVAIASVLQFHLDRRRTAVELLDPSPADGPRDAGQ